MRRLAAMSVVAVFAASLLTACGDGGATPASNSTPTRPASAPSPGPTGPNTPAPKPLPSEVTVNASLPFRNIEAYAPLLLAEYFGEFKKENIKINIQLVQTNNLVVLMQKGDIDVAPAAPSAGLFNAIAGGADIKGVGGGVGWSPANHQGYYVRKSLLKPDGTFSACDLKGKKVSTGSATGLGSPAVVELAAYLKTCNLTVKDVTIVPLGGADLLAGLDSGAVDAGNLSDPVWTTAETSGHKLIIPFTASITSYWMGKIRTEKPDVAAAILRALVRTSRTYLQGDYRGNAEVKQGLIKAMGATEAQLNGPSSLIFDPDFKFPIQNIAPIETAWAEIGGIVNFNKPLSDSQLFDDGPRTTALAG
ncbi:ABC transporter substrate-binding protein [Dactylosporangium sp. AC04546]|uniref:ABC transporter substrate-binding protein n=1 Tax=Dactylosporangium sp. AC04546 TaxID=2862460 RepID=UPI001EE00139|nr:ABC transporter substrate-binding protein [Dactylosporangium sp. AC04546]WVK89109.1 ABC transporter substrate-binding protein [Dactylosporangium sp. AC04546]